MPRKRDSWLSRIKQVEREFWAVRLATDRLLEASAKDPTVTRSDVLMRDVRAASDRLEGTYVIRLFAEFETGLRLCWRAVRTRRPPARTEDLLTGTGAREGIPDDLIRGADEVREYRNALIHEREEEVDPIPIATARGHLCRFFGRLPPDW